MSRLDREENSLESWRFFRSASHIEGEQEAELLAEYEAFNKQQQQKLARQQQINASQSPNKRRPVRCREFVDFPTTISPVVGRNDPIGNEEKTDVQHAERF